jgi:hypothetical protein
MALPRPHRPSHATVVAYLALVVAVGGGTAFAATGGTFVIGKANKETTTTSLTRTTAGAPLTLVAKAGSAPLAVSSTVKVAKLNADLLDGKDSTAFQPKIARLTFTPLTMTNGWKAECFFSGLPGIALGADGTVHFHGSFCRGSGTLDLSPFTLPVQFRPTKPVWLPVDTYQGTTGRIDIGTDGVVYVEDDPHWTNAGVPSDSFVSLAGVTYTLPY